MTARVAGLLVQMHAAAPTAPVGWRVLTGNNRVLARGTQVYVTPDECVRAITAIQHHLPRLRTKLARVDAHRWNWELHSPQSVLAMGGHAFDRLIRCEQGLAAFRASFGDATVRAELLVTGTRRFGSVA